MNVEFNSKDISILLKVLEKLALTSTKVLQAAIAEDEILTRTNVDQMRQLFADLSILKRTTVKTIDDAPITIKTAVSGQLATIAQSESFIAAWCRRYEGIKTITELSLSPEGLDIIIDQYIPSTWSWATDIIILYDYSDLEIIKALIKRGQQRIVIFCSTEREYLTTTEKHHYIKNFNDAEIYFQQLGLEMPDRSATINFSEVTNSLKNDSTKLGYEEVKDAFFSVWRRKVSTRATINHFGYRWLTQGLENLPYVAEHNSISVLQGKFVNLPMVIISPGPSLDKNIEQLKELQGKALLVSTQPAAIALCRAGVIPNIVILLDPLDCIYQLDGLPWEKIDALLLGVSCHPNLYKNFREKILTFNVNSGIDNWISDIFNESVRINTGGSVATAAMHLSKFFDCNPIILVGQDLALTNDKQYATNTADGGMTVHFDDTAKSFTYGNITTGFINSWDNKAWAETNFKTPFEILPGYYGGSVKSKADYKLFHAEFEKIAKIEKESENPRTLLNCTEGGAYIEGFDHIPLREAINLLTQSAKLGGDPSRILKIAVADVDHKRRKIILTQKLKQIKTSFDKNHKLAIECNKISIKVEKSVQSVAVLNSKEKELMQEIKESYFIAIAYQTEISDAIKLGSLATNLQESLQASRSLYNLVIRSVSLLYPILQQALKTLDNQVSQYSK